MIVIDRLYRAVDQFSDPVNRQPERIDRAFQAFQKIDAHQATDAFFTTLLRKARPLMVRQIEILGKPRRHDKVGRSVDRQVERHEKRIDIVVIDRIAQVSQARPQRDRRETFRKFADVGRVIIFFDMLSGTGDRHAVQQLKKVKIQRPQKSVRRAFFGGETAPRIERLLCLTEYLIDTLCYIELFIDLFGIPLIGKGELIFKVDKFVVDRRCGKHQNFCPDACADDFIQQL